MRAGRDSGERLLGRPFAFHAAASIVHCRRPLAPLPAGSAKSKRYHCPELEAVMDRKK